MTLRVGPPNHQPGLGFGRFVALRNSKSQDHRLGSIGTQMCTGGGGEEAHSGEWGSAYEVSLPSPCSNPFAPHPQNGARHHVRSTSPKILRRPSSHCLQKFFLSICSPPHGTSSLACMHTCIHAYIHTETLPVPHLPKNTARVREAGSVLSPSLEGETMGDGSTIRGGNGHKMKPPRVGIRGPHPRRKGAKDLPEKVGAQRCASRGGWPHR